MTGSLFTNQSTFKRAYAKIIHNVLRRHKFTKFSFIICEIIETLQMIYLCLHPRLPYNANIPHLQLITNILSYLHSDRFISSAQQFLIYILVVYVLCGALFLLFVRLAKVISRNSYWGEYQLMDQLGLEVINVFMLIIKTFLFVPWTFALFYSFKALSMYSLPIAFLIVICSLAAIGSVISFTFMCTSHFVYRNPFIDSYMAGPKNRNQQLKIIARFMLICYLAADPFLDNATIFQYYSFGLNLFLLYRTYYFESYYDKLLDDVNLILFFLIPYLQILTVINMYAQVDVISLFCFGGLLGVFATIAMITNRKLRQNNYIFTDIRFRRQSVLLNYVYAVIEAIKEKQQSGSFIRLIGAMQYHVLNCEAPDCRCQKARDILKTQTFDEFPVYNFLSNLLYSYVDNGEFNDRTALLAGYISNWKQQIVSKSLFYLDNTIKNIPPIPQLCTETCVYREMLMIEDSMKKNDVKNIKNLDFNKFFNFQKQLSLLQTLIEANVQLTRRFWQEVRFDDHNVKLIRNLGSKIIKQREAIQRDYFQLQNINIYKQKIQVYLIFVMFIIATDGFEKIRKNMDKNAPTRILKQYFTEEFKRDHLSEKGIVVISGNLDNGFANVLYSNRCITNLYGFNAKQLIGKPIGTMMPEVIAEKHNQIIDRYLLKQKVAKKRDGFVVTVIDKEGFLQPSLLVQKILPKLDRGIQIVGFLSLVREDPKFIVNYFLYRGDSEEIIAISKDLRLKYGMAPGRKLWQVFEDWDNTAIIQEQMRSKEGYQTNFKEELTLIRANDPLLLRMRQQVYYFKVHLRLVAVYQNQVSDVVYNKSKLTEALTIGAKSNLIGSTSDESAAKSDDGRTHSLKMITFVLLIVMISSFGTLFGFRLTASYSAGSYLNSIDKIANISNAISQSTFYLRQIELARFFNSQQNLINNYLLNLTDWQTTLNSLYYEHIRLSEKLRTQEYFPLVNEVQFDGSAKLNSFSNTLQDYISRMYTLIQSKQEFQLFDPTLNSPVSNPTFYKTLLIVKNSAKDLLPAALKVYALIVNALCAQFSKFSFWIVAGCAIGVATLLVLGIGWSIQAIKNYLDQAIEIFSHVPPQQVALMYNNCSYFLDYYFPKETNERVVETTAEDMLLNANQQSEEEDDSASQSSRNSSSYFRNIPVYITAFLFISCGLFAALGYLHDSSQKEVINSANIMRRLHTRATLLKYLRTYATQTTISGGNYSQVGLGLLEQSFANQRAISSLQTASNIAQYRSYSLAMSSQDVCALLSSDKAVGPPISGCQNIAGGVFTRGASSAISSYLEFMRVNFATTDSSLLNASKVLSNTSRQDTDAILDGMATVTSSLITALMKYQKQEVGQKTTLYSYIVGGSFLVWVFLGVVALWMPLIKFLENESCWSKNFLTLIPSQAIASSQYLKAYSNAAQNKL